MRKSSWVSTSSVDEIELETGQAWSRTSYLRLKSVNFKSITMRHDQSSWKMNILVSRVRVTELYTPECDSIGAWSRICARPLEAKMTITQLGGRYHWIFLQRDTSKLLFARFKAHGGGSQQRGKSRFSTNLHFSVSKEVFSSSVNLSIVCTWPSRRFFFREVARGANFGKWRGMSCPGRRKERVPLHLWHFNVFIEHQWSLARFKSNHCKCNDGVQYCRCWKIVFSNPLWRLRRIITSELVEQVKFDCSASAKMSQNHLNEQGQTATWILWIKLRTLVETSLRGFPIQKPCVEIERDRCEIWNLSCHIGFWLFGFANTRWLCPISKIS